MTNQKILFSIIFHGHFQTNQKHVAHSFVTNLPLMASQTITRQLEIVGLCKNNNGRSCCVHDCCGKEVQVGSVLRLVQTVVTINEVPEEAIKCVLIANGSACSYGSKNPFRFVCVAQFLFLSWLSELSGVANLLLLTDAFLVDHFPEIDEFRLDGGFLVSDQFLIYMLLVFGDGPMEIS
jgi:hypothetical protein